MNTTDKKHLREFSNQLENMNALLTDMLAQWQERYDSKSEKWQEGEAGEKLQSEISTLEEIQSNVESAFDSIEQFEGLHD